MKKSTWFVLMIAAVFSSNCYDKREKPAVEKPYELVINAVHSSPRDTCLIGVLGEESAMSSLQIITDDGDTLSITKTSPDGINGKLLGEIRNYTDRVMLLARIEDDNEMYLNTFLNISQLEGHWKDQDNSMDLQPDSVVRNCTMGYRQWSVSQCKMLFVGETSTEYGLTQKVDTAYIDYLDADSLILTIPRHGKMKFGR